ncbi:hypothetical protein CLOM_g10799 [Closterium sp. NIES-68]|nr:hypothetical protein CLOM_g10799 [Closterium sp. NIES-68]GJP74572.1 hypothetical protein CLOP_g5131 [Closterium sp. NIES-67]
MARNSLATVFVANLDPQVDDRILYDLMQQAGPLVDLHMPRDKASGQHRGYGFAEYETEESAQYAVKLFSGLVRLFNRQLRFQISNSGAKPAAATEDPAATGNGMATANGAAPLTTSLSSYDQQQQDLLRWQLQQQQAGLLYQHSRGVLPLNYSWPQNQLQAHSQAASMLHYLRAPGRHFG